MKELVEYYKKCSGCGDTMIYGSKHALQYSIEKNRLCKECLHPKCTKCNKKIKATGLCLECYTEYRKKNRLLNSKDPSTWKRKCPLCGNEIIYTNPGGVWIGNKHNSKCLTCYYKLIRKPKNYCKECGNKLSGDNKSGCCNICYIKKNSQETLKRKTYHCPRCAEYIFSNDNSVTKKNIERGYCYKCLDKEVRFTSIKKSCIICHNEFTISDYSRRNNKTCSNKCTRIAKSSCFPTKSQAQCLNDFIKEHGTRYDYNKVIYKNSTTKIEIICKDHGSFWTTPNNHINGRGCPKCQVSKGERKIIEWLNRKKIQYIHQHRFTDCRGINGGLLVYDFFLPTNNILIEFDGQQHFGVSKIRNHVISAEQIKRMREHDRRKDNYAMLNKIKMIHISYTKIKGIDNILQKEIYG